MANRGPVGDIKRERKRVISRDFNEKVEHARFGWRGARSDLRLSLPFLISSHPPYTAFPPFRSYHDKFTIVSIVTLPPSFSLFLQLLSTFSPRTDTHTTAPLLHLSLPVPRLTHLLSPLFRLNISDCSPSLHDCAYTRTTLVAVVLDHSRHG